ncbi:MAG: TdeIII family type II restriction endonuclease [Candidatus Stygibacter frigidus]|nr:TdeIII family type II restriction endonuclease [Candidatus Stygibacter frigidus]
MIFNNNQRSIIEKTISDCLHRKFSTYKSVTNYMPFHFRLLGKDRMALYSFIQSLNTTFGTSIFEPVALELATTSNRFARTEKQIFVGDMISEAAQREIQSIIDDLTNSGEPNKIQEVERLRKVCRSGKINKTKPVRVDLYLESKDGKKHLFDLKTAKPNVSNFKDFKRTILEWAAICLYNNPDENISTYIAIPYNPYEPKPYQRWTLKGMLDFEQELKVASEFWDFLGGVGAYDDLLDSFERVGLEMREEIDKYFERFNFNVSD